MLKMNYGSFVIKKLALKRVRKIIRKYIDKNIYLADELISERKNKK